MYSQKDMHITLPNMHKKWVIQKIFILLNFYLKWEKSFFKKTDPAINIKILFCSIIYHWKDPDLSLKRPWCQEKLEAGGEANDRGWDGWMASLTQWTWIWVNSGSWWWTGRSAVHGVAKSQTQLSDWTEGYKMVNLIFFQNTASPGKFSWVSYEIPPDIEWI